MMGGSDHNEFQTALDWAARIQDPTFDDWDAHLAWIEQSPSNALLYRKAALALSDNLAAFDQATVQLASEAANDDERPYSPAGKRSSFWLVGTAAAIAASAAAIFIPYGRPSVQDVIVRTAAGETRTVSLPDGTSLRLNGDTIIKQPAADPRRVILDRGEVFVDVTHDVRRPFRLVVGDSVFQDEGTSFNVRTDGEETTVGVVEGVVAYDPEHADIRIAAGRSLAVRDSTVVLSDVAASEIGSWQSGRLTYSNARIGRAATDLSRSLGTRIIVSARTADVRFSGVIVLTGKPDAIINRFALLSGLTAVRHKDGWALSE